MLQYKLIRMLALPQNNIFIVGDDDQSIYGFRGARPEIMLNFEKDFSDVKKVFLSVNYRSQAAIVRGAGCVIKNNKQRFDKQIQAVRPEEDMPRCSLWKRLIFISPETFMLSLLRIT